MSINIGNEGSILTIYKDDQGKYKTYIKGTETQEDGEVKDIFMSKKIQFKNGVEVSKKIGLMSKEELTEWIRSNK